MPERISRVVVTPVAFADPPLLNVVGVHQPWALRAIVEVHTDSGLLGLGETYADEAHLARLAAVATALPGHRPVRPRRPAPASSSTCSAARPAGAARRFGGMLDVTSAVDTVYSPFEVACLDLQGHETGRTGERAPRRPVRDSVPFSGYLFYKWAGHPGFADDAWGEALTPDQLVAQAHRMVDGWGFGSLKLKGGVLPPEEECDAIEALRDAFPDLPLRLDPNGAWTAETSLEVASRLAGVVEYLEDPTPGIDGHGRGRGGHRRAAGDQHVRHRDGAPAARDRVRRRPDRAVRPPPLGRPARRRQLLAGITETWGLGLSMHSNSHLGVSLAAMTHLAAATPTLTYACDTHYPWKTQDLIKPRRAVLRRRLGRRADGPGARRRRSTATCSGCCTSSTSPAAYDGARTPSTCAPSSRTSRSTPPAGEPALPATPSLA